MPDESKAISVTNDDPFGDGTKPWWWKGFGFASGFFVSALLGTVILAVGVGGGIGATSQAQATDVTTLVTGQRIYATRCQSCHGVDGEGGVGLPIGNGAVVEKYPNIERQLEVIAEGRGSMPSFASRLSPEEIRAVATYEREQLGRESSG